MAYPDHQDFVGVVVDLITDAPVPYADSPNAFFASYFQTSIGAGVGGKRRDRGHDAVLDRPVEALELALGTRG